MPVDLRNYLYGRLGLPVSSSPNSKQIHGPLQAPAFVHFQGRLRCGKSLRQALAKVFLKSPSPVIPTEDRATGIVLNV